MQRSTVGVPSFGRFPWLVQVLARGVHVCLVGGIPPSLRGLTFRVTSQLHCAHAVGNQRENFRQLYFAPPRGIKITIRGSKLTQPSSFHLSLLLV